MTVTIENTYTGNGSTTDYSFTFQYLDTTDIKVSIGGNDTTAYSLLNATTVRFNSAPDNGDAIRIYRNTSFDSPKATFYPGSAIRAGDLNDNTLQNLYVTQEANDDILNAWKKGDSTILSSETWASTNTQIGTTAAIEGRIDAKITAFRTTNVDIVGNITVSGTVDGRDVAADGTKLDGIESTGLDFNDDVKVRFGTGNDLEIYHDGSHSYIKNGQGSLKICDTNVELMNGAADEYMLKAIQDEAVELYYDNSKKLATSGSGVEIENGDLRCHLDLKIINDNRGIYIGAGQDLRLYHDGTDSYLDNHTGDFYIRNGGDNDNSNIHIQAKDAEESIVIHDDGAVELYHDGYKKFETTSTGATVTGTLTATAFSGDGTNITNITSTPGSNHDIDLDDNKKFICGDGDDLQIYHDGTDNIISNSGTTLAIHRATENSNNPVLQVRSNNGSSNRVLFEVDGDGTSTFAGKVGQSNTSSDTTFTDVPRPASVSGLYVENSTSTDGTYAALSITSKNGAGTDQTGSIVASSVSSGKAPEINITQRTDNNEQTAAIKISSLGNVELNSDGVKKFETTSTGVTVTGNILPSADNTGDIGSDAAAHNSIWASTRFRGNDNVKLVLGDAQDFQIYHNGTNYIDASNGHFYIRNNVASDAGGDIFIEAKSGETNIKCQHDGYVELYYDGNKKFETTSVGCRIGGSTTANTAGDDLVIEGTSDRGLSIISGNISAASIYFGDTDDTDIGRICYQHNDNELQLYANAGKKGVVINSSGAVELYYDNSKKFETTSTGAKVTGRFESFLSSSDTSFTDLSLPAAVGGGLCASNLQEVNGTFSAISVVSGNANAVSQSASFIAKCVNAGYAPEIHITQRTGSNAQTTALKIDENQNATFAGGVILAENNAIHFRGATDSDYDAIVRESSGNALLINGRNDVILNIDSNNDSTDSHFAIAHGAATSSSTELFKVEENGNATFAGDVSIGGSFNETIYSETFDAQSETIDPANGTIQRITLSQAGHTITFTNMTNGESVLLMVEDGSSGTVTTWTGVTWVGGSAPTLATSGYSLIEVWKAKNAADTDTVFACYMGDVA